MICPNCKKQLINGSEICPNCGTNLKNIKEETNSYENKNYQNGKKHKLKKDLTIILMFLIAIFIGVIFAINRITKKLDGFNIFKNHNSNTTISLVRDENGNIKFIDGTFTTTKVKNESDAFKALNSLKSELKFQNGREEFSIISIEKSENITYYKFQQKYKNVDVYGNNLIISVDSAGKVLGMNGYYTPDINIDVSNKKSEEEIKEIVIKDLEDSNSQIIELSKYIYLDNQTQYLVFIVSGYNNSNVYEYIINANTGEIINKSEQMEFAAYKFKGQGVNEIVDVTIDEFYDVSKFKTRYRLVDPDRNIEIIDGRNIEMNAGGLILSLLTKRSPMIGDLEETNFKYLTGKDKFEDKDIAEMGVTTLNNLEEIYDYYFNVLGRKSYDGKGGEVSVHIGPKGENGENKYQNASWYSGIINQMYIGYRGDTPFSVSKDVLAHEFTHAVAGTIVKFADTPKEEEDKAFEPGALSEGIADIMGCLIENKDWTINENIEIIRDLENPEATGNPSSKGEKNYFPDDYDLKSISSNGEGGIHKNATVPGHAAYLMWKNGAFSSKQQMAKIWYNSLFLMSPYSNFEDCALAVIKTAKNQGLSEKSINIIEDALKETKMLDNTKVETKTLGGNYTLTVYIPIIDEKYDYQEISEVYSVSDGTKIYTKAFDTIMNKMLGGKILKSDGKKFEVSVRGETVSFSFYYKGTDIIFDFSEPITEDVEIEAKCSYGEEKIFDREIVEKISQALKMIIKVSNQIK